MSGEADKAKDDLCLEWQALSKKIHKLKEQLSKPQGSFVFNFVEVSILCLVSINVVSVFIHKAYDFDE